MIFADEFVPTDALILAMASAGMMLVVFVVFAGMFCTLIFGGRKKATNDEIEHIRATRKRILAAANPDDFDMRFDWPVED